MIEKLNLDEIKPSSRRYPAIIFETEREAGDQILNIQNLSASQDGDVLFKDVHLNMAKGDKIVVFSKDSRATTAFYDILNGLKNKIQERLIGELLLRSRIYQLKIIAFLMVLI